MVVALFEQTPPPLVAMVTGSPDEAVAPTMKLDWVGAMDGGGSVIA